MEAFRKALLGATYDNKSRVLTFEEPIPWEPYHKSIYVRTHYEAIVDYIFQEDRYILVSGNPGTGKSQCAVYALYRALQDSKVVLYHRSVDRSIFLFKRDERVQLFMQGSGMPSEHYEKDTLYFYDAGTRSHPEIQFGMSRRIYFSFPSRVNTADFIKQHAIVLNMPIWDIDELKAAAKLEQYKDRISMDEVCQRYDRFGGIARYILHPDGEQVDRYFGELLAHISRCNIQTLRTLGPMSDETHMLFHRQTVLNSGYKKFMFDFASQFVEDKVFDAIEKKSFQEMIAFVNVDMFGTCVSSLQGVTFERIAHMILPQQNDYIVRSLSEAGKIESRVSFLKATRKVFYSQDFSDFDMGSLPSGESVYLQPKTKTFPAADSFRLPDCIFQCTKASKHTINESGLETIITKLKQHRDYKPGMRFKFYFVVSKKKYDSSFEGTQRNTKSYNIVSPATFPEVDQYVLNLGI